MDTQASPTARQVATFRSFSRFYTRQIGLLENRILKSSFSLAEARILYELAHRESTTATELSGDLGIDPGYLSRMVKKFEARGLVTRRPSPRDGRQSILTLAAEGREVFALLDRGSARQVEDLLKPLSADERKKLVGAMQTVERLLTGVEDTAVPYVLRPHQPGDIGWITHRQAVLYNREYGWDGSYEALVAEILSDFVKNFDPRHERAWIAEREREIVGSVFVVRGSKEVAQLRLLYVEPWARGLGIGSRLVDECIRFARETGKNRLTLWTNHVLVSARRIYQAAGFQLMKEEKHHSFGKDLVGQHWDLVL